MSDFVIHIKEGRAPNLKIVSVVKPVRKTLVLVLKLMLFISALSVLIFMSMRNDNLMLSELLLSGGILSLVFFIHILSNR